LELRWRKLDYILIKDRIRSFILSLIFLQRCGRREERRLLSSFNAMLELGLLGNSLVHLENSETIEIWNSSENKKSLDNKKRRNIKLKLKEECILSNTKTLRYFTMNLKLGD
jgi:hypothetical protein